MADILAGLALLACVPVFFIKNPRLKAVILSVLDFLLILLLIGRGIGKNGILFFAAAAAVLNALVYFAPAGETAKFTRRDIFIAFLNAAILVAAADFCLRHGFMPGQPVLGPAAGTLVFIFMAAGISGYFLAGRGAGEEK
jgi:predicted membrane-bound mannosyltransferase